MSNLDAAAVAERARAAGETVAVVVPALDEEATVGEVVGRIRADLVEQAGLVDELVVVDGGSRDATAAVATAAGGRVVAQADGASLRGKGAGLARGVEETTSSIVVFVDADVVELDTGFVTALVAPLVDEPAVMLTKAAYDRPLATAGTPTGGGRVTELTARPLIATFWPELGDLAQPLAGEYAGRRSLLTSVPFVAGYGVELALLVDTLAAHGRDAIRQVDLGAREHTHQPLDALGRMSAEILQVALTRAADQGRQPVDGPVLRQPVRTHDGIELRDHEVTWAQRPPLAG